ncbi:precorrin-2 C(20)-methyltransferase [Propionimicrobium sp. PCR01-08-3]|uniref:precorrin-2 C(20)-methyltransferase n=1 Tax=Propionimicrobium sp. PCR01-08-3 TaxID=3052086 RepID=UPI00255CAF5B|nr:precorrin-2 C(20)-methyltransferase [Propionimicrobium sp. PCR01-08-3]WIY82197.1 precorrin-2 C(20)-methyltransferase [Propionimicrobium sp. PCR01-08-3]
MSESAEHATNPHILFGIGVGPGDPELITVKAVNALRGCDAILVPATEASGSDSGRAETIVLAACPEVADKIVRIPFSMADRTGVTKRRADSWQASADQAVASFNEGATAIGFATIGDPSVYSTFSYLASSVREQIADVQVEVIPGITAMQALAAASRTPLVEGDEILALVPLKKSIQPLLKVAEAADTCVIYKAGRHLPELKDHLAEIGEDAIAGINIGLPNEQLSQVSELENAPYFTSVLWPAKRSGRGQRL